MASLNAGPEFYAAEERYRSAKTYDEKMAAPCPFLVRKRRWLRWKEQLLSVNHIWHL